MKNFRVYSVVLLIATLMVLSTNVVAEEELKVKGVTVYVIYKAPINQSNDFDLSYLASNMEEIPYVYQVLKDRNSIEKLQDKKLRQKNCQEYEITYGAYGFLCNDNDIDIFYDGYWLIGRQKISNTEELRPLNEIKNLTWSVYKEIRKKLNSRSVDSWSKKEGLHTDEVLIVIHFSEILPLKLSQREELYEYEVFKVEEMDTSHKDQICDFLWESKNCDSRFVAVCRLALIFPLFLASKFPTCVIDLLGKTY